MSEDFLTLDGLWSTKRLLERRPHFPSTDVLPVSSRTASVAPYLWRFMALDSRRDAAEWRAEHRLRLGFLRSLYRRIVARRREERWRAFLAASGWQPPAPTGLTLGDLFVGEDGAR